MKTLIILLSSLHCLVWSVKSVGILQKHSNISGTHIYIYDFFCLLFFVFIFISSYLPTNEYIHIYIFVFIRWEI